MSKIIARRSALAAGYGAVVTGLLMPSTAKAAARQSDDSALLALCHRVHDCERQLKVLNADPARPLKREDLRAIEGQKTALVLEQYATVERIAEIPANSFHGVAAKAALVSMLLPIAVEDLDITMDLTEIRLVMSLAKDAAALC
ncbi:hypothetical protein [Kozakia baliensis]|uniref:hypothetical protein n=1 Tax=Kozakia baliensis TaxID=153496 RepID=UPI000495FCB3|nr:hypothetical protein [Kozakia baliensis]